MKKISKDHKLNNSKIKTENVTKVMYVLYKRVEDVFPAIFCTI